MTPITVVALGTFAVILGCVLVVGSFIEMARSR